MKAENKKVVCFGEVVWDILPNGRVPGGAPVNVAYHLHQHGVQSSLITRIGKDEAGAELRNHFAATGMNTDYFQIDPAVPTGTVIAAPDGNGNMTYDIIQPAAWDNISIDDATRSLVSAADCFIYGSLAARNEVSRNTLLSLLELVGTRVMDVNLRAPFYSRELLTKLMSKAQVLKLNEEELALIGSWFEVATDTHTRIRMLAQVMELNIVIVTRGPNGALVFSDNVFYEHPGFTVKVADTVGSGDAFLAGFVTKWITGSSIADALHYAVQLGALIATKKGGCPAYQLAEVDAIRSPAY